MQSAKFELFESGWTLPISDRCNMVIPWTDEDRRELAELCRVHDQMMAEARANPLVQKSDAEGQLVFKVDQIACYGYAQVVAVRQTKRCQRRCGGGPARKKQAGQDRREYCYCGSRSGCAITGQLMIAWVGRRPPT